MSLDTEDRAIVSICTSHIADVLPILQLAYLEDLFPARSSVIKWIATFADRNGTLPKISQVNRHFKDVKTRQRAEPLAYCIDTLRQDLVMETAVTYSNKQADAVDKADMQGYVELSQELVQKVEELTKPVAAQSLDSDEVTKQQIANLQKLGMNALRIIKTGLQPFDDEIGGLVPGMLYTLSALVNLGKTYVALKVAETARASGYKVQFYSLEMPSDHIADRTLCIRYKLSADEYVRKVQPEASVQAGESRLDWYTRILEERQARIDKDQCTGKLFIRSSDEEYITPRRIAADIKRNDIDLVIIDAAQDLRDNRLSKDRTPGLYNAISEINAVAMGAKPVPVLFTVQLDAEVEKKGLSKGNLTRIAWGQMFAQKSAVVMTMLGDRTTTRRDVRIDKTRDGTVGKPFHIVFWFPNVDIVGEEIPTGNLTFDESEVFDSVDDLDGILAHAEAAVDAKQAQTPTQSTYDEETSPEEPSEPLESPYQQRQAERHKKRMLRKVKRRE